MPMLMHLITPALTHSPPTHSPRTSNAAHSRATRASARVIITTIFLLAGLSVNATGCGNQRSLGALERDGEFGLKQENWTMAKSNFGEFVERKPEDHKARYKLGLALIKLGECKDAMRQLALALEVRPLDNDYADAYAEALLCAGERDELTATIARLAAERGGARDFVRWGTYASKLGNIDEAQQALLTGARLDRGTNLFPQRALANFYKDLGDRERYIKRLRMCYYLAPTNEDLIKEIRATGEILGPTFALVPEEYAPPAN